MTEHNYDWAKAPLWVKYAATDKDGTAFFWQFKPSIEADCTSWFVLSSNIEEIPTKGNGADWENSLREIPEREAELNRLADSIPYRPKTAMEAAEMLRGSVACNVDHYGVTDIYGHHYESIKNRRLIRIEAGLIKKPASAIPNNNMLSNLLAFIHRDGGHYEEQHGIQKAFNDAVQIVAKRNSEQPVSTEWKDGLPPVGEVCMATIDGMLVADSVLIMGYFDDLVWMTWQNWDDDGLYYGSHKTKPVRDMEFRPIETEQQKAERERAEEIFEALAEAIQEPKE